MTDKRRRRMNGKEEHITIEITQKKRRPRRRRGQKEKGGPRRTGRPRERNETLV